jgi:methylphosphotriester-DNA--protein-cysteine methyltransferase
MDAFSSAIIKDSLTSVAGQAGRSMLSSRSLGYADVTTFIEAFRRWKGMPPSEFRRRQGVRAPSARQTRVNVGNASTAE